LPFAELGATIAAGTPAGAGARRLRCAVRGLAADRQVRWTDEEARVSDAYQHDPRGPVEIRSPGIVVMQLLYVTIAPVLSAVFLRSGASPAKVPVTVVGVVTAIVLAWSFHQNIRGTVLEREIRLSWRLGPLTRSRIIRLSDVLRIELPEYRDRLIAHFRDGSSLTIASRNNVITGALPELEFAAGVAHGPRRTLRRLKYLVESRAAIDVDHRGILASPRGDQHEGPSN